MNDMAGLCAVHDWRPARLEAAGAGLSMVLVCFACQAESYAPSVFDSGNWLTNEAESPRCDPRSASRAATP